MENLQNLIEKVQSFLRRRPYTPLMVFLSAIILVIIAGQVKYNLAILSGKIAPCEDCDLLYEDWEVLFNELDSLKKCCLVDTSKQEVKEKVIISSNDLIGQWYRMTKPKGLYSFNENHSFSFEESGRYAEYQLTGKWRIEKGSIVVSYHNGDSRHSLGQSTEIMILSSWDSSYLEGEIHNASGENEYLFFVKPSG